MPDEIMTIREVATYLRIKEKTAYRLAAEGKIPSFKVGSSWRFRRNQIEAWIDDRSKSRKQYRGTAFCQATRISTAGI